MNKGKLLKTILAGLLALTLVPAGNVGAEGEGDDKPLNPEKYCDLQKKNVLGDLVTLSYKCYGLENPEDTENFEIRTRYGKDISIDSVSEPKYQNGLYVFTIDIDYEKEIGGNFTIDLYKGKTLLCQGEIISIPAVPVEPEDPEEPEEPDVPETPTGNVFMITEGTQIPTIKVNEETEIEIPVTCIEKVTHNEAQFSVKLPDGIYFTEIANIQNVEFTRRNDYESYIAFKVMANSDVASGVYPITLNAKYKYDGQPNEDTLEFYVKVVGKGDVEEDDEIKGKPRIIIDSYSFGGSQVMGGMPFNLALSFKNTSTNVDIKNLKITVQSAADEDTGGVFTPTASSNSFFVDTLNKNTAVSKSIVLMPRADAKPKSYGVDITFEYEAMMNGELREFTSTERISIPVVQSDRFEIGEVSTWGDFYVGEMMDIMVNYVNKGKTTINNLEITIESEQLDIPEKSTYVGNVESGNSDMFSTSVTALMEGDVSGTVTFKYEDSNGSPVEVVKEFSGTAINPWVDPGPIGPIDPEMPIEPENTGMSWWQWALIAVVVIGAAAGGLFFFKKKKKAQKDKEDAAFDDFDEA